MERQEEETMPHGDTLLTNFLQERFGEAQAEIYCAQMLQYMELTLDWNKKVNLTSITNPADFIARHFFDSLALVDSYELEDARDIVDVGTGGGFPGIPLAICFPAKRFVLLDSLAKRLRIVSDMVQEIGLNNVTTVHGRAEDLAHQKAYREKFDLCVARAVAPLSVLAEYCLPFVAPEGTFVAYKGSEAEDEAMEAEAAILSLGGALSMVETSTASLENGTDLLSGLDHRLVYIEKEERTPKTYPRKAGTPAKKPL